MSARRVVWSRLARADLADIRAYLLREAGMRISARVVRELRDLGDGLSDSALGWEAREELASGLRRALRPPYGVYFRVTATRIEIIRILHGARDLHSLFGRDV